MLRRRRKTTPKGSPSQAPPAAARSHRRPRRDARVPPELMLAPEIAPEMGSDTISAAKSDPASFPKSNLTPFPGKRSGRPPERVVLVTGFEPFGGDSRNPSWEVCERLPGEIGGMRVEVCRVPCEFRHAIEVAAQAIERHRPALVVSLGLAAGRTHIGVERVAINRDDARIADNAGARPLEEPVAAGGPPAYFSTLPVQAMVAAMRRAGVPAEVSSSAGTFVCNHLMYGVLHFLAASGRRARAGFIHVPSSEEMALDKPGVPSMAVATMVRGIGAAIEAAIEAAAGRAPSAGIAEGGLD